jgi:hypothetical protein
MSLGSGSTIPVTEVNFDLFLSLSGEFGNSNLYISLLEHFDNDFLRSQIRDSTTLDLFNDELIGHISSTFYIMTKSELDVILFPHSFPSFADDFKRRFSFFIQGVHY